ncbi:hypothetical protein KY332_05305, partial [Candidatus Woesearchaeota archaeon]|nr:hypothetical protein [Candidatus Woesearchaeota archaeon]
YLSVSSKSKDYKIRLLEMVYIDLNGDDKDDISLTYLGIKAGKADVRIRLVPRKPLDIGGDSASYVLDLGEAAPVDLEPSKIVHIAKPIAYIFAVGAIIFLIFIVGRTIYKSYPEIFKKDKFLKFKLFKKTKKR